MFDTEVADCQRRCGITVERALMADNQMSPMRWIPPASKRLLDVGCNVGELLMACSKRFNGMGLCGVDVNAAAVERARKKLPQAEIYNITGHTLPFADSSFDCVTCIEVIEHVPEHLRAATLREIWRVLAPDGTFVLRCPHAGMFAALDSNNLRFRFPHLYRLLLRRGLRDDGYAGGSSDVIWHYHFTKAELLALLGPEFSLRETRYGGLLIFPIGDILRWPFYRLKLLSNPVLRLIDKIMDWDMGLNYGQAAFTILLVLRKPS
jgi:SAM-dependent methyltransferase